LKLGRFPIIYKQLTIPQRRDREAEHKILTKNVPRTIAFPPPSVTTLAAYKLFES
jgi:hypothetical protein